MSVVDAPEGAVSVAQLPELVIVDDEVRVGASLERELSLEFAERPFSVRVFTDPRECVDWVSSHPEGVFLVISDLRMPGMNGSDLLAKVRQAGKDIQTILLTAYVDIPDIQKAVSTSIMSLLFKPWSRDHLVAEVERALSAWSLRTENARLRRELDGMLESAGDFQRALFAHAAPSFAKLDVDVAFLPHDVYHCGGDFYRILDDGAGGCLAVVGDVAGHGPKPAMVAAMATAAIGWAAEADPRLLLDPGRFLAAINDRFCAMVASSPELLMAMTAIRFDPDADRLSFATAGQPPAWLLRGGRATPLHTGNTALGAVPGQGFASGSAEFLPGDLVFCHTDGLTESVRSAWCLDGPELAAAIEACASSRAAEAVERFKPLLPGAAFSDDVTVLRVERLIPGPA